MSIEPWATAECSRSQIKICLRIGNIGLHEAYLHQVHARGAVHSLRFTLTGSGAYGAVGFAYGTAAVPEEASASEADSSDEDSEEEEERPHLDDEEVDNLAANMGIEGYSSMLRRVERQEAEFAAGNVKRAK